MCSQPNNESWIKKMYREKNKQKLSVASLETLAIIAYKQPITRLEIESIRGVNVDGVTRHLLKLGLIKTAGRKEVIGRPFLHITTRKFLEYFGLNTLKDLPRLEEFAKLEDIGEITKSEGDSFNGGGGENKGNENAKKEEPGSKITDINSGALNNNTLNNEETSSSVKKTDKNSVDLK